MADQRVAAVRALHRLESRPGILLANPSLRGRLPRHQGAVGPGEAEGEGLAFDRDGRRGTDRSGPAEYGFAGIVSDQDAWETVTARMSLCVSHP